MVQHLYFKHLENHLKYSIYIKIIIKKKILLVITDGDGTDGDPINYVLQESEKNDVYIIGCF